MWHKSPKKNNLTKLTIRACIIIFFIVILFCYILQSQIFGYYNVNVAVYNAYLITIINIHAMCSLKPIQYVINIFVIGQHQPK